MERVPERQATCKQQVPLASQASQCAPDEFFQGDKSDGDLGEGDRTSRISGISGKPLYRKMMLPLPMMLPHGFVFCPNKRRAREVGGFTLSPIIMDHGSGKVETHPK